MIRFLFMKNHSSIKVKNMLRPGIFDYRKCKISGCQNGNYNDLTIKIKGKMIN